MRLDTERKKMTTVRDREMETSAGPSAVSSGRAITCSKETIGDPRGDHLEVSSMLLFIEAILICFLVLLLSACP